MALGTSAQAQCRAAFFIQNFAYLPTPDPTFVNTVNRHPGLTTFTQTWMPLIRARVTEYCRGPLGEFPKEDETIQFHVVNTPGVYPFIQTFFISRTEQCKFAMLLDLFKQPDAPISPQWIFNAVKENPNMIGVHRALVYFDPNNPAKFIGWRQQRLVSNVWQNVSAVWPALPPEDSLARQDAILNRACYAGTQTVQIIRK